MILCNLHLHRLEQSKIAKITLSLLLPILKTDQEYKLVRALFRQLLGSQRYCVN